MRRGWLRSVVFTAAAMFAVIGLPASVLASTSDEPAAPSCDLPTTSVVAGTPLELSGPTTTSERAGVLARKDTGESREGTASTVSGTWRAVILFSTEDAGHWTIDLSVDGTNCVSPLMVTLPAGVTPAPARLAVDQSDPVETPVVDASTITSSVETAAALLVVLSWIALVIVAIAGLAGATWPGRLHRLIQAAIFIGVLGAFVGAGLVVYFEVSMSHFDTGIPDEQKALLDVAMWVLVAAGSAVGAIAARRVRTGTANHAG
jgi:hypothetical protein